MRRILLASVALTLIGGAPVFAQTETTPAEASAADVVVLEETVDAPEIITAPRESSWYGKPYAIDGFDVVSYQAGENPLAGSETYTAQYDNTEWRFASAENRDEFLDDPEKYVPEFGGYCPVNLAEGKFKIGSARDFTLVDEKLYFSVNERAEDKFSDDPRGYIAGAKLTF